MQVKIHNCTDRTKRTVLREATILFCRELLPYYVRKNLKIDVIVRPYIKKYVGQCSVNDDSLYPRRFEIEISPYKNRRNSIYSLVKTLGHEIIHVKQYALREIWETRTGKEMWKSRHVDESKVPYHKRPWEIEAAANEENMWELWKMHKSLVVSKN